MSACRTIRREVAATGLGTRHTRMWRLCMIFVTCLFICLRTDSGAPGFEKGQRYGCVCAFTTPPKKLRQYLRHTHAYMRTQNEKYDTITGVKAIVRRFSIYSSMFRCSFALFKTLSVELHYFKLLN